MGILCRNDWGINPGVNKKRKVAHALLTLVLIFRLVAWCSFNWVYKYLDYLREISPPTKRKKTAANTTEFVFGNPESRDSTHAKVTPICFGGKFTPVKVRLIDGDAVLPSRVGVIGKLRLTGDFGNRYFHAGQAEWKVRGVS